MTNEGRLEKWRGGGGKVATSLVVWFLALSTASSSGIRAVDDNAHLSASGDDGVAASLANDNFVRSILDRLETLEVDVAALRETDQALRAELRAAKDDIAEERGVERRRRRGLASNNPFQLQNDFDFSDCVAVNARTKTCLFGALADNVVIGGRPQVLEDEGQQITIGSVGGGDTIRVGPGAGRGGSTVTIGNADEDTDVNIVGNARRADGSPMLSVKGDIGAEGDIEAGGAVTDGECLSHDGGVGDDKICTFGHNALTVGIGSSGGEEYEGTYNVRINSDLTVGGVVTDMSCLFAQGGTCAYGAGSGVTEVLVGGSSDTSQRISIGSSFGEDRIAFGSKYRGGDADALFPTDIAAVADWMQKTPKPTKKRSKKNHEPAHPLARGP